MALKLNRFRQWISRAGCTKRRRGALRTRYSAYVQSVQTLESRQLLTAPNPLDLNTLDGTSGFQINGEPLNEWSASAAGDVNGDGYGDIILGGPDEGNADDGAAYLVFGRSGSFGAEFDLADLNGTDGFRLDGINDHDYAGTSVGGVGDFNNDGFDDIVVGAYGADPGDNNLAGEAYVVFGKATGFSAVMNLSALTGTNGFRVTGVATGDWLGRSVSGGDVNGDGFDDLIVGASRADSQNGRTYVFFGTSAAPSASVGAGSLDGTNGFRIDGFAGPGFGGGFSARSVSAAGDVNGDGYEDVIIGAPYADVTGGDDNAGHSYVVFGKPSGFPAAFNLADLNGTNGFQINGIDIGDLSGESVSSAGDVNGDGFADVIIGARGGEPGANTGTNDGESYVVFGRSTSFPAELNLADLNGTNGFRISGLDEGDQSGSSVSAAGDVNGDGFDDVLIGSPHAEPAGYDDGTFSGESYIVFGRASGFTSNLNLSSLDGDNGFRIQSTMAGDQTGNVVSSLGDINGDGFDDFFVGTDGDVKTYVIYGGNFTGGIETQVGTTGADMLTAVQGPSSTDILIGGLGRDYLISDGGPDVIIAGHGNDLVSISDLNFTDRRRVRGGRGTDRLLIRRAAAATLDFTNIADNRISNFEEIEFTDTGNTVTVNQQEILRLSDTSNALTVFHSNRETFNRGSGWIQQANEVIDSRVFEIFTQGAAVLKQHTVPIVGLGLTPQAVGEDTSNSLVFTFTRDETLGDLTVRFATSGTAISGIDYTQTGADTFTPTGGSITFADGQANAVLTILPTTDQLVEQDEFIHLTLAADPERRYLTDESDSQTGTINDDDTAVITIDDVNESEAAGALTFTIATSNAIDIPVSIRASLTGDTATANNVDFNSTPQTITFAAGQSQSRTVSVPLVNDDIVETTESFLASLSIDNTTGTRSIDVSDTATGSITDNDTAVFTIADVDVAEDAGTATLTVAIDKPFDVDIDIDVSYTDVTAVGASGGTEAHYDNDTDRLTIPAGSLSAQAVVAIVDDDLITGDRTFTADITLVTDIGTRRSDTTDEATVTIIDDTAKFEINDVTVNEEAGTATFTVSLNSAVDIPVAVSVSFDDASATGTPNGVLGDFDNTAREVLFEAGTTGSHDVTIAITDDDFAEGVHIFSAKLSSPTDAGARSFDLSDSAIGTIVDDETVGFLITESDDQSVVTESGDIDSFTVKLLGQPEENVVLTIASSRPGEVSVLAPELTFTPTNWDSPQTVELMGVDDLIVDGNQISTISVAVNAAVSTDAFDQLPDQTFEVVTEDNDSAAFTLSHSELEVSETGSSRNFTVVLDRAPLTDVVMGVTASAPDEATVNPTAVTFTPQNWDVPQQVDVTGIDDLLVDGDQFSQITVSINVEASNDAFDLIADQSVDVTTTDDDTPGFSVSRTAVSVSESGTSESFTVVLNRAPLTAVALDIAANDQTEATVNPPSLTFGLGNWHVPQTVSVIGIDDEEPDADILSLVEISVADSSDPAFRDLSAQQIEVTTVNDDIGVIAPRGTSTNQNPELIWTAIDGARDYEVWLEHIGGAANPVINPTVADTSFRIHNALAIGRYRAWVRANLTNSSTSAWITSDFQISVAPVVTVSPANGMARTPTITWNPVRGASSYRLYVHNNTAGTTVLDEVVDGTQFVFQNELAFGRHDIWVRAIGIGNYTAAWSEIQKYHVEPTLIGPDYSTFNTNPEFSWTSIPGIATYQLYVAQGPNVLINRTGITANTFQAESDFGIGTYRWWIRAFHSNGRAGRWSEAGEFTVGGSPRIIAPSTSPTSSTPEIQWEAVEGAGFYEIYIFNDDTPGLVHRQSNITDTSYASFPLPDGNYRVWVKSYRVNGDPGRWSRAHSFEVDDAANSLTATPASEFISTFDTTPVIQWSKDLGVAAVDLYLRNGDTIITQNNLPGSSFTPTTDLSAGVWQWWARAKDSHGASGPWSTPAEIDVTGRALLVGPSESTASRRPLISWTSVVGAGRYKFQLDNLTTGQSAIIRDDSVVGTEFRPSTDLNPGTYRAWVQAVNAATNVPGPWSLRLDFTITG